MAIIIIQGEEEKNNHIHYEVNSDERELGTGGMGQVRRGVRVDEATGIKTEVAIKFLFDDLPLSTIERARREASIRLNNDNLVEMLGFIESVENGIKRYHVVSELLHGVMLFDLLKGNITDSEGHPIEYARKLMEMRISNPELFTLTIMKSVLSGVMALHDSGYVHRDIDPSNIMITSSGTIKLLDFGIAKRLKSLSTHDQQFTTTGVFMGKAGYAAPELVLGDVANQNETTDIYSLGILMFQLLTGHQPFEGASNEVMEMQCKAKMPLKEIRDKRLRKIIGKATEKKQADRYRTISAMRVALEESELAPGRKGVAQSARVFTSADELPMQEAPSQISKVSSQIYGKVQSLISGNKSFRIYTIGIFTVVCAIVAIICFSIDGNKEQGEIALDDQVQNDTIISIDQQEETPVEKKTWIERLKSENANNAILNEMIEASANETNPDPEAAFVYGGLLSRQNRVVSDDIIDRFSTVIPQDPQAAHIQYQRAFQADSNFYKAAYEIGVDYAVGNGVEIDLEKASSMMQSGLTKAQIAGDKEYETLFQTAIEKIGL